MSVPSICSKLFLFGTTQFGLGLLFLIAGGQMVSATENPLINMLETPAMNGCLQFGTGHRIESDDDDRLSQLYLRTTSRPKSDRRCHLGDIP
jgi:hypothetical protein